MGIFATIETSFILGFIVVLGIASMWYSINEEKIEQMMR